MVTLIATFKCVLIAVGNYKYIHTQTSYFPVCLASTQTKINDPSVLSSVA